MRGMCAASDRFCKTFLLHRHDVAVDAAGLHSPYFDNFRRLPGALGEPRAILDRPCQLAAGSVDVSLLAERWLRSDPELRITWLENWVTGQVHARVGAATSHQSAEPVRLPGALLKPKITPLFGLLDAARDFRRLASTGMNQQLALEALLLEGRNALTI